jgi:Serine dehydrogenase proteinase
MSISLADKDGFDEVTRTLPKDSKLDILLHSPGGSAEATESIVALLRARFSHIRFIIPDIAKSAATMLAMSGEQLVMDERSELGPTDPQMIFTQEGRVIVAPAQAIKDQFKTAQDEINADPKKLPSWVPILGWYGPALLAQCDNQLALAEELVSKWLEQYMFAGDPQAQHKAKQVAEHLADHNKFRSHGRRVGMDDLNALGANILDMRTEPNLHNAVRELYTAITLTFNKTVAYKIVENSDGEALIGMLNINLQQQPPQDIPPTPPAVSPVPSPSTPPLTPNRQVRRQAAKKKR